MRRVATAPCRSETTYDKCGSPQIIPGVVVPPATRRGDTGTLTANAVSHSLVPLITSLSPFYLKIYIRHVPPISRFAGQKCKPGKRLFRACRSVERSRSYSALKAEECRQVNIGGINKLIKSTFFICFDLRNLFHHYQRFKSLGTWLSAV